MPPVKRAFHWHMINTFPDCYACSFPNCTARWSLKESGTNIKNHLMKFHPHEFVNAGGKFSKTLSSATVSTMNQSSCLNESYSTKSEDLPSSLDLLSRNLNFLLPQQTQSPTSDVSIQVDLSTRRKSTPLPDEFTHEKVLNNPQLMSFLSRFRDLVQAAPTLPTEVLAQTACIAAITVIPNEISNKTDSSTQTSFQLCNECSIQNTSSSGVSMQNGSEGHESDKENLCNEIKQEKAIEENGTNQPQPQGHNVDLTKKLIEMLHNQNQ